MLMQTLTNLLPLDWITADPDQPRKHFDPEALQSLADSLKSEGQLQPIVVQRIGDEQYQIVAGERRYRACQLAGIPTIRCELVRAVDPSTKAVLQLVENMQREDLTLIETVNGCAGLVELAGLTEAARRLGKSKAWVSQRSTLTKISEATRQLLVDGLLQNVEIAHYLEEIEAIDPEEANSIREDIRKPSSWSPAPTRDEVREALERVKAAAKRKEQENAAAAHLKAIADQAKTNAAARQQGLPISEPAAVPPPPKNETKHEREYRLRAEAWVKMEPELRKIGRDSRKAVLTALQETIGQPEKEFVLSVGLKDHYTSYECPPTASAGDLKIELRGGSSDAGFLLDAIAPKHQISFHVSCNIDKLRQIEAILGEEKSFTEYVTVRASTFEAGAQKIRDQFEERVLQRITSPADAKARMPPKKGAAPLVDESKEVRSFREFLSQRIENAGDDSYFIQGADLQDKYAAWCKAYGYPVLQLTDKRRAALIEARGLTVHRHKTGRRFVACRFAD